MWCTEAWGEMERPVRTNSWKKGLLSSRLFPHLLSRTQRGLGSKKALVCGPAGRAVAGLIYSTLGTGQKANCGLREEIRASSSVVPPGLRMSWGELVLVRQEQVEKG